MSDVARASGWVGVATMAIAATVPIVTRIRAGKRLPPTSIALRTHAAIGVGAALMVGLHTLAAVPSLGEPETIGQSAAGLVAAAFGFLLMIVQAGLGAQLRGTKLRDRPKIRRFHVATAMALAVTVAAHVVAIENGAGSTNNVSVAP